jgi:hypothetical protein
MAKPGEEDHHVQNLSWNFLTPARLPQKKNSDMERSGILTLPIARPHASMQPFRLEGGVALFQPAIRATIFVSFPILCIDAGIETSISHLLGLQIFLRASAPCCAPSNRYKSSRTIPGLPKLRFFREPPVTVRMLARSSVFLAM